MKLKLIQITEGGYKDMKVATAHSGKKQTEVVSEAMKLVREKYEKK